MDCTLLTYRPGQVQIQALLPLGNTQLPSQSWAPPPSLQSSVHQHYREPQRCLRMCTRIRSWTKTLVIVQWKIQMKSEMLPYWGWGDTSQRMFRHEWTHTSCRLYCPLCLQWLQSLSGPSAFLPLGFCLLQLIKNQKIEKFGNGELVLLLVSSLSRLSQVGHKCRRTS